LFPRVSRFSLDTFGEEHRSLVRSAGKIPLVIAAGARARPLRVVPTKNDDPIDHRVALTPCGPSKIAV